MKNIPYKELKRSADDYCRWIPVICRFSEDRICSHATNPKFPQTWRRETPSSQTSLQVPTQASTNENLYGSVATSACVPVTEITDNLPMESAAFAAGDEYKIM
jgi:hypothetical protein